MLDKNIKKRTIGILKIAYSINIPKKAGEQEIMGSITKKCEDSNTVEELFDLLGVATKYLVLEGEASHRENEGLEEEIKKLEEEIKKLRGN